MSDKKWLFWFCVVCVAIDAVVIRVMYTRANRPASPTSHIAAPVSQVLAPAPEPFKPSCPPRDFDWMNFEVRHFRVADRQCQCVMLKDGAVIAFGYPCD